MAVPPANGSPVLIVQECCDVGEGDDGGRRGGRKMHSLSLLFSPRVRLYPEYLSMDTIY